MSQLFKNAACFTDIHYGLKQNSRLHLSDCERFIDWFIAEAKARNAETCIFLGDWHHHRASVNIATMNQSIRDLKKLNDAFEKVYVILGNHDLYYREKRDLNSIEFARDLPNIVMIDEHFLQDDVAIIPWLCGDEYKQVAKMECKYMFAHLELPYFKMNALVEMPDHVDRGAMFLEWGKEPQYVNWLECPKYKSFTLKELLDQHESLLDEYTYARVKLDISISYEEANFIREKFAEQYNVRELQLIPIKEEEEAYEGGEIKFESVDQIVITQLETIDSTTIDRQRLIDIYNGIET